MNRRKVAPDHAPARYMQRILLVVLLLAAFPVRATVVIATGNDLYERLADFKRSSSRDVATASTGVGFVLGVAQALDEVRHPRTGFKFCLPPKGVPQGQLSDAVLHYLEKNPQLRHLSAYTLVQSALDQAFPCKR